MKTKAEIEAEIEIIDGLRLGASSDTEAQALENYSDALLWVLGQREDSPSERMA